MIKETLTYTDYDNNERTEDFYFNLNEAEIAELELSMDGGLIEMLERIVAAQDGPTMFKMFKKIVLASYGEKSADGRRFMKKAPDGHRLADDFAETEAYNQIFTKLITSADYAAKFVNGIIPSKAAPGSSIPAPAVK